MREVFKLSVNPGVEPGWLWPSFAVPTVWLRILTALLLVVPFRPGARAADRADRHLLAPPETAPVRALAATPAVPTAAPVRLRSAAFLGVGTPAGNLAAILEANPQPHVIVQFDRLPDAAQRERLADRGIRLLDYLPERAYFASFSGPVSPEEWPALGITWLGRIYPEDRLSPRLREGVIGSWARRPDGSARLRVKLFTDVALEDGLVLLQTLGAQVISASSHRNQVTIDLLPTQLDALAELDAVRWVEEIAPPSEPMLDGVRASIQADSVQAPPYDLTGAGVVVGIWDVGQVDATHPDFAGRIEVFPQPGGPGMRPHATHVAGIVGGSGAASLSQGGTEWQWRGVAPGVQLLSFDDPDSIEEHGEAIRTRGLAISQNSWGVSISDFFGNCGLLGDYSHNSPDYDSIINGSLFGRPVTVVFAAGNARKKEANSCPVGPYRLIGPPSTAKNVITVGAIFSDTGGMTPFSSWGPTDDGRLKPEIVAAGAESGGDGGVTSTYPGGKYAVLQGTSMATPAVSGVAALLVEDHRRLFNGQDPLPSTVRALLLHSALDLDDGTTYFNPGPDYASGFGQVRAKEAVDQLRGNGVVVGQIGEAQTNVYRLSVPVESPAVKLTLAWDDVAGAENAAVALVNDLDLVVIDPTGERRFPWTLDPANPARAATQDREDHLNVVEQVFVNGPVPAGEWLVQVVGHRVPEGPAQKYSLAFTPGGITAAPLLALERVVVDDATAGFGDGLLDPGETIQAQLLVRNTAGPAAIGLRGRLVSESPGVKVLGADSAYPDVLPGATATNLTLFSYRLAKSLECGSSVVLRLELKLADTTGYTNFIRQRIGRYALTNVATNIFEQGEAPLPIPDGVGQAVSTNSVPIPGLLRRATVSVRIDHPWVGDLQLSLEHPDGTLVPLVSADALNGRNLGSGGCQPGQRTTFDDDAPLGIRSGTAPYVGRFKPESPLLSLIGRSIEGDWKLRLRDVLSEDPGTLNCWSLRLDYEQSGYVCQVFNRAPVVSNTAWNTPFALARSYTLGGFDPDEDPVVFTVQSLPSHGTISGLNPATGSFVYTPAAGYIGPDQLQFVVRDGLAESAVGRVDFNVLPPQADLGLGLSGPDRIVLGERFTNLITVTNFGPNRASLAVVTNRFPDAFTVVSLQSSQGVAPSLAGLARWDVGDLAAGGQATAVFVFRALTNGDYTSTAQVAAKEDDPETANNTVAVVQQVNTVADLALGQAAQPTRILIGQTTEILLTVTNLGPAHATRILLTNELPERLTLLQVQGALSNVVQGRRLIAALEDLAAGTTATVRLSLRADAEGAATNQAAVGGAEFDFVPTNNLAQALIQIVPPADLSVGQSFSPALGLAKQEIVCLVTVTNQGPTNATAIRLTDTLPAGFRFVGLRPEGLNAALDQNRVTVEIGNLAAGADTRVELVLVPSQVGTFTNLVEVAPGGEVDPHPADNAASVVIPVSTTVDLAVTLEADLEPAPVNRPLGWSIVVTNKSLTRVPEVVVTNWLPAGVTLAGVSASQGTVRVVGASVVANLGELTERGTALVRVVWKPNALGSLTNRAEVGGALIETNAVDNVAFAVSTIRPETDLAVSTQGINETIKLADEAVLEIAVTNRGPAVAAGWLAVNVPTNLTVISATATGDGGTPTVEGSTLVLPLIALPAGGGVALAIRVLAAQTGEGMLRAVVTTVDADPQPADNTATVLIHVRPATELTIAAPLPVDPVYFGHPVRLQATLTNQGPYAADDVAITSQLPSGLRLLAAPGAEGEMTNLTAPVVFRLGTVPPGGTVAVEILGEPSVLGALTNVWSVTSGVLESNLTDNVATQILDVQANADLAVNGQPPDGAVVVGRDFEVVFGITNRGPNAATLVQCAGTLPAGLNLLALQTVAGQTSFTNDRFEVRWPTLEPGANDIVRLTLRGDSPGAVVLRTTATAAEADLNPDDNQGDLAVTILPEADLAVSAAVRKPVDPLPIFAGQPVVIGIDIANAGPRLAPGVWVRDFLPPELAVIGVAPEGLPISHHDGYVQVEVGDLVAGGVTNIQLILVPRMDGALVSRVEVGAAVVDEAPENNSATVTFTAQPGADLALQVQPSQWAVGVGREAEFFVTVTNRGPSAATGVNAIIFWQGMAELLAAEPATGDVEPAELGLRWSVGPLESGGEARLVLRLQAGPPGVVQAAAIAAGNESDPDSGNDTAAATVAVREETELRLVASPATTNLPLDGEWVQWITLTNVGSRPAANIVLTNLLPAGGELLSAEADQGRLQATNQQVLLALSSLPVNAGASLKVRWQPAVLGPLTSVVQVGSDGVNVSNEPVTATLVARVQPHAELALTPVAAPPSILHGAETTWHLAVTNKGPHAAPAISVTVELPAGLEYLGGTAEQGTVVPDGAVVEFQFASLAPKASAAFTLALRGATPGGYTNQFRLAAAVADFVASDDQLTLPLTVVPVSDLGLAVTAAATNIAAGADFQLLLAVTNRGYSPAAAVFVTNTMPPGVTFVGATSDQGTSRVSGKAVIWSVGELPMGGAAAQVLTLRSSRPGPITNLTQIGSTSLESFPADNEVAIGLTILPSADLGLAITVEPAVVPVHGEVAYTLTVMNNGPLAATGLRLTNQLPSDLAVLLITAEGGGTTLAGRELVWTLDRLANGAAARLVLRGRLEQLGTFPLTSTVMGAEPDPNLTNNFVTGVSAARVESDLAVTTLTYDAVFVVGQTTEYEVDVTNHGPAGAPGVEVINPLPPGMSPLEVVADQGTWAADGNTLVWRPGSLASGETVSAVFRAMVEADGVMTNTVQVKGEVLDSQPQNDTDVAITRAYLPIRLRVTATNTPGPYLVDVPLVYTFTVTNVSSTPAPGVNLLAAFSDNMEIIDADSTRGTPQAVFSGVIVAAGLLPPGEGATLRVEIRPLLAGDLYCVLTGYSPAASSSDPDQAARIILPVLSAPAIVYEYLGNRLTLTWPSVAASYVLESADSLAKPVWTQVATPPTATEDKLTVVVKVSGAQRFYRLHKAP